jgi:hypothetical protein
VSTRLSAEALAAMDPVRAALRDRARADRDALLHAVDAEVAARLTAARKEAAAVLAEARAQGERDAATARAAERARARRQARAIVLRAQRASYEELVARSRIAVGRLRAEPALLDRLHAVARATLGPSAVVGEDPDGGVVADTPGRHLDLGLVTLADQAVAALGAEVEALWRP